MTTPRMPSEEALKWMLDPTPAPVPSPWDRNDAFRALEDLAPEERAKAYLQVVAKGRDDVAPSAAGQLIKERIGDPTEVANAIVSRGLRISEGAVDALVGQPRIASGLLIIPRRVLKEAVAAKKLFEPHGQWSSTAAEVAALVLAEHGTAADVELIRQAVQRQPNSRTLWFALAAGRTATGSDTRLAQAVYRDRNLPDELRLAAATAVAFTDAEARAFAISQIEGVLAKFGDKDENATLATAPSFAEFRKRAGRLQAGDSTSTNSFYEPLTKVLAEIHVQFLPLTALRFLHVPQAKDLAGRLLNSVNPWCHEAAALASALRWPELLLAGRPAHLPEKQYAQALAVLVLRHPERKAEAEKAFGKPIPREALEAAAEYWPSGFGEGGLLVRGW